MTLLQLPQRAAQPRLLEGTFQAGDGTELFYRAWLPPVQPTGGLLLVHRGHEHSGRFEELVHRLDLEDVAVFAYDARGHGRSPGERGHAPGFSTLVRDLDAFAQFIAAQHGVATDDLIVLGHSVGAVVAAAWVHDYAPPVRGMILATPALRVKLYVPLARQALRLRYRPGAKSFVRSYVSGRMLTHDGEQAQAYAADPLISRQIALNILLELRDVSTRLLADAAAIRTPALLLAAGSDWVVRNSAIRTFFNRLSSPLKELHVFDGFRHSIFHEARRELPIGQVQRFIQRIFQQSIAHGRADTRPDPHSLRTFDQLRAPLRLFSPRHYWLGAQKLLLRSAGRLSHGVSLGWRCGFSSGPSLDHVYQNVARGTTIVGRLIDRIYLNAIGWRSVRQRKEHLQQMLRLVIEQQSSAGSSPRIVDIASGPGRYLLEVLDGLRDHDVFAVLRDRNSEALQQGRALAAQMRLENVQYVEGDAFDPQSLARVKPPPNIAVVSGLYELISDNEQVLRSLRGLAAALPKGGMLIYTNQPWHPQLELIARVLTHGDGSRWIMRCRPQHEMDALVRAAGFEKVQTLIGDSGICTVSLARRI